MKVRELKSLLDNADDENEISICVESPGGYICPDGCTVPLERAACGIDWHGHEFLLVPRYRLKMTEGGFGEWKERK